MAFRAFRFVVGVLLGALSLWMIISGAWELIGAFKETLAPKVLVANSAMILGGIAVFGVYYWALWADSRLRRVLENIFSIPELLKKLAFTVVLLAIYRVGFHVPLPGVDKAKLEVTTGQGIFSEALAQASMLTGGSFQQSSLFGLGIMPYISASIIFQLLVTVVPSLEKLRKEGPAGAKKIQEYTRYATVGLCVVQAAVWMRVMKTQNILYTEYSESTSVLLMGLVGMTAGTVFLMWLGEQIDEYGIGNGISLIIMAGIAVRLPVAIGKLGNTMNMSLVGSEGNHGLLEVGFIALAFVAVVAGAILITQGQRRIPIQQAKHTRGRRVYGGQKQYLPLRVNHGGVMPIIFASSLMIFPNAIFRWMAANWGKWFEPLADAFAMQSYTYTVVYILMIFFFAYFWTTVQFRPKEMADQLRDYGSFIPGLRPGRRTAEYLERVMGRITFCGAAFLAVIAVVPSVLSKTMGIDYEISNFLGGTGLLILVSVTLDLVQRIEANLVMRNYGGFLGGSSKIKGAYA